MLHLTKHISFIAFLIVLSFMIIFITTFDNQNNKISDNITTIKVCGTYYYVTSYIVKDDTIAFTSDGVVVLITRDYTLINQIK